MQQGTETQAAADAVLPLLRRILLVTDFSSCSEAAAPFAQSLSDSYGGSVAVAHVISGDLVDAPNQAVFGSPEELAAVAERNMRAFVVRSSLESADTIVAGGTVATALAEIIAARSIDAVVVGTHGRTGLGKLVMGSVAQRIFNAVPCPVVTVSPRARRAVPDAPLRNILYATDFSEPALKALPHALSLAKVSGSLLLLVHVAPDEERADFEGRQARLAALVPAPARSWLQFEPVALCGDPAVEIVRAAAERRSDFIVVGARRVEENVMYRVNVPWSTAYQVVAHASCPVLRVRT